MLKKHATIDEFLAQHLPRGALAISQHVFGAGATRTYAPLPVTKRFVYRDRPGSARRAAHLNWALVKSIVKCSDYGDFPKVQWLASVTRLSNAEVVTFLTPLPRSGRQESSQHEDQ